MKHHAGIAKRHAPLILMKNVEVILRNDMLKQFESALHRLKVHSDTSPDEPS